jgi:hypothetical protein
MDDPRRGEVHPSRGGHTKHPNARFSKSHLIRAASAADQTARKPWLDVSSGKGARTGCGDGILAAVHPSNGDVGGRGFSVAQTFDLGAEGGDCDKTLIGALARKPEPAEEVLIAG